MDNYIFQGYVDSEGRVPPQEHDKIRIFLKDSHKKGKAVRITMEVEKDSVTNKQFAYYRKVMLPMITDFHNKEKNQSVNIADEFGRRFQINRRLDRREINIKLKEFFLGYDKVKLPNGESIYKLRSTKGLTRENYFYDFILPIHQFYLEFFDLNIPLPS